KKTLRCHVPEGFCFEESISPNKFFKTNAVLNANFSARLGVQVLTSLQFSGLKLSNACALSRRYF
ncbi:hypothetical protein ACFQAT_25640, partial [Undibacterium arcticum]|uniref:hypothetical protein n=1 Tax=Undibacterium arcticum TaxID=1762892 RepID=UPI003619E125